MIHCCDVVARFARSHFLTRVKLVIRRQGIDCGLTRPPLRPDSEIPESEIDELVELIEGEQVRTEMRAIG